MEEIDKIYRALYEKIQILVLAFYAIAPFIAMKLNLWHPPKNIAPQILMYIGGPLILTSLYLTSHKKIFPQRIGDLIHNFLLILLISIFAFYYGDGIRGHFLFLYFLLIAYSILLLDHFIPLFLGGMASLIVLSEFLLARIPFGLISIFEISLQIIAFLIIGIIGSKLVKEILSEQKVRQELQRSHEELKRLDKAKTEFISIASHQLRTPLTAIKGYISMILEGTYGGLSERTKKPLEDIYKTNERLIKLVNDLLNVSRIEAGKMELDLEESALEDIISSVVDELRVEAEKKGLYLKLERPEKPLPKVLVDRDKIRQVILNIVDNAIRYTNHGYVALNVKCQMSNVKTNGKIIIEVKDTGEGMTKEEIGRVFESFSRGRAGTRFWTEGVGLGLYVAKKFVEMHKGRIWAESPGRGKGSIFYIELPIKI